MFSAAGLSGDGSIDVEKVNSLIYDGTSPTSRIVGLMYYGMTGGHPEGFAGPNDHWHRHTGVCIKNGPNGLEVPFPADADVKKSQCDELGRKLPRPDRYGMVHVGGAGMGLAEGRVQPRQPEPALRRRHRRHRRRRVLSGDLRPPDPDDYQSTAVSGSIWRTASSRPRAMNVHEADGSGRRSPRRSSSPACATRSRRRGWCGRGRSARRTRSRASRAACTRRARRYSATCAYISSGTPCCADRRTPDTCSHIWHWLIWAMRIRASFALAHRDDALVVGGVRRACRRRRRARAASGRSASPRRPRPRECRSAAIT